MGLNRTSINIAGTRITDQDFTSIHIIQDIGDHHQFECRMRRDPTSGLLLEKCNSWIGEAVIVGIDLADDVDIAGVFTTEIFKGVVTSVGMSRERGTSEIVVRGNGPSKLMDGGPNTRSFTEMTLQAIVDEVFGPYQGAFPKAPQVSPVIKTDPIPYCVQYKESDFDFINRLANRYGEWCFYDGENFFYGKNGSGVSVNLDFGDNAMHHVDLQVEALPSTFSIRAYDYKKDVLLEFDNPEKKPSNKYAKVAFDKSQNEMFTQKPLVTLDIDHTETETEKYAKRREQIHVDRSVIITGDSVNAKLRIGGEIKLTDVAEKVDYGSFVITHLEHHIEQGGDYINSFKAIPKEMDSPSVTGAVKPPMAEAQVAKVKDVSDEDSLGRIKVEFLWQEGTGQTSPWIRVLSPYVGKDKGFYIIPEVDDKVWIEFENGDPDKPYMAGAMYHKHAEPEYFNSNNHYKGFKSKGGNYWKFDDAGGKISIRAPKEIDMSAGKKISIHTDGGGDSEIIMNTGDGTITILAKTINILADETLYAEGKSNGAFIQSDQNVVVSVSNQQLILTTAGSDLEGQVVSISGTTSTTVTGGGGKAELAMGMVKLNS